MIFHLLQRRQKFPCKVTKLQMSLTHKIILKRNFFKFLDLKCIGFLFWMPSWKYADTFRFTLENVVIVPRKTVFLIIQKTGFGWCPFLLGITLHTVETKKNDTRVLQRLDSSHGKCSYPGPEECFYRQWCYLSASMPLFLQTLTPPPRPPYPHWQIYITIIIKFYYY